MKKLFTFLAFVFFALAHREVTTASFFLIHEPEIPKSLKNNN
ncbi:cyclic lactone autoinducer peptide [Metabacillus fastidiosus]|nr:cyclic lactone autoinducer peptide [Metabacillus fastidiosus]